LSLRSCGRNWSIYPVILKSRIVSKRFLGFGLPTDGGSKHAKLSLGLGKRRKVKSAFFGG
jgi:hypothetical protein